MLGLGCMYLQHTNEIDQESKNVSLNVVIARKSLMGENVNVKHQWFCLYMFFCLLFCLFPESYFIMDFLSMSVLLCIQKMNHCK